MSNQPTPARLRVFPLPDPSLERCGHRPGSPYVEAVWVGVLGPSATWAWQRLARVAAAKPGAIVDSADLARSLGLGENLAANASISRTLGRLADFGCAYRANDAIAVRLALPDVSEAQARRLAPSARLAHEHLARHTARPSIPGHGLPAGMERHFEGVGL